jgi:hypothetical protein
MFEGGPPELEGRQQEVPEQSASQVNDGVL